MGAWLRDLAALRREMESRLANALIGLFGFTLIANTSAIGDEDQVEKADETDPDSNNQKGQRQATRILPFGIQARAPKGLRSFWVRLGSSNIFLIGLAPQEKYGPNNLEAGEMSLYCMASGTRVWLDKNGAIHIDAASGQDVIVNGGSAKVSRLGDNLTASSSLATWALAVEAAIAAGSTLSMVLPSPLFAAGAGAAGSLGAINQGADHFKG